MSASNYFLTTARLGFRCWSQNDRPLALALWADPDVARFIGGPFPTEKVNERLAQEINSMTAYKVQYWPLFLLAGDEHVGCGGLRPYRPQQQIYELGVHLRPAFWGLGLAAEACRAIITFAFDTVGAKALFAGHNPANDASRRLLHKLGFRFTHDEFYPPTGLMHPSYVLERTRGTGK